jgi:hypothetical protein
MIHSYFIENVAVLLMLLIGSKVLVICLLIYFGNLREAKLIMVLKIMFYSVGGGIDLIILLSKSKMIG